MVLNRPIEKIQGAKHVRGYQYTGMISPIHLSLAMVFITRAQITTVIPNISIDKIYGRNI